MGEIAITGRLVTVGGQLIGVGRALVLISTSLIVVGIRLVAIRRGLIQFAVRSGGFWFSFTGDVNIPFPLTLGTTGPSAGTVEGMHRSCGATAGTNSADGRGRR